MYFIVLEYSSVSNIESIFEKMINLLGNLNNISLLMR